MKRERRAVAVGIAIDGLAGSALCRAVLDLLYDVSQRVLENDRIPTVIQRQPSGRRLKHQLVFGRIAEGAGGCSASKDHRSFKRRDDSAGRKHMPDGVGIEQLEARYIERFPR